MIIKNDEIEYKEFLKEQDILNPPLTEFKLCDWWEERLRENKKLNVYGALLGEYRINDGFIRCQFRFDGDYNKVKCSRNGIPSQITYKCIDKSDSPFFKFTVKKLNNICRHIYSKLNDEMNDVMLKTYINYSDVPIKFELDYLEARSFKGVLDHSRSIKAQYLNYLDFMDATGLFEYELNHIDEIHEKMEEQRTIHKKSLLIEQENRIKRSEVRDSVVEYLKNNYDIHLDDCEDEDEDEDKYNNDYCERLYGNSEHYEEILDDYDFYEEVSKECPAKYKIYKWCPDTKDIKIFMSSISLTSYMAMKECYSLYNICSTDLDESIKTVEGYLKIPVKYIMTLEEYVKRDFIIPD